LQIDLELIVTEGHRRPSCLYDSRVATHSNSQKPNTTPTFAFTPSQAKAVS
jgi:hypothetical protein